MRTLSKISIRRNLRLQNLLRILRDYRLILIIDVLVLSNLIRLLSIRSVLTLSVNLSRSQLLKGNRSLNRLRHITINSDLHINLASRLLRSKGRLTLTQNSLFIGLANQLSLQRVFLTRNQALIADLINNLSTSNNLMRTLSKISIRRNLRLCRSISRLFRLFRRSRARRLSAGRSLRSGRLRVRRLRGFRFRTALRRWFRALGLRGAWLRASR